MFPLFRKKAAFIKKQLAFATLALGTLVFPSVVNAQVVISQVYANGNASGSAYKNDFIELFNRGSSPVDLSTWSIYSAMGSVTTWDIANLSGTIAPGKYFLIQASGLAAGTNGTSALPAPDFAIASDLPSNSGKVALVANQDPLSPSNEYLPGTSGVMDMVGYGATGVYGFEGSGPTGTDLTGTTSVARLNGGCTDTNDNNLDFATQAPAPRNSASSANVCSTIAPSGACCKSSGTCVYVTAAACATFTGAAYKGDYVACAPGGYAISHAPATLDDITTQGATDITGAGGRSVWSPLETQPSTALPFEVIYFGQKYLTYRAQSVGLVTLSPDYIAGGLANNGVFGPAVLAPYWDSLSTDPSGPGRIYTLTKGTSPNRQFIIQWNHVPFYSGIAATPTTSVNNTFQVIFNESSQVIEFRYGDVVPQGFSTGGRGATSTASFNAGISDASGLFEYDVTDFVGAGDDLAATQFTPVGECPVSGACCAPNGTCTLVPQGSCAPHFAFVAGTCSPSPCPILSNFEVEPNDSKSTATPVTLASGGSFSGALGNDYFLVTSTPAPLAIYRHELTPTMFPASASPVAALGLYGLTTTTAIPSQVGTLDVGVLGGNPGETIAWYGFGRQERVYIQALNAPSNAFYTATLQDQVVQPIIVAGTATASSITMSVTLTEGSQNADMWLYDETLHAIPGAGNNDPAKHVITPILTRTLAPGTYYVAVAIQNFANNLPSPDDEFTRGSVVLDFPDAACGAGTGGIGEFQLNVVDSDPSTPDLVQAFETGANGNYEVSWLKFTVGASASGICCRGSICDLTLLTQSACNAATNPQGRWSSLGAACNSGNNVSSPCCSADYDKSNAVNVNDIFAFLRGWFAHSSFADADGNGSVNVNDIFAFLRAWFSTNGHCSTTP